MFRARGVIRFRNEDELVRVAVGQPAEHDSVDGAEDSGAGADHERQGNDDAEGKGGTADDGTKGGLKIALDGFAHGSATREVSTAFLVRSPIKSSKAALRCVPWTLKLRLRGG